MSTSAISGHSNGIYRVTTRAQTKQMQSLLTTNSDILQQLTSRNDSGDDRVVVSGPLVVPAGLSANRLPSKSGRRRGGKLGSKNEPSGLLGQTAPTVAETDLTAWTPTFLALHQQC